METMTTYKATSRQSTDNQYYMNPSNQGSQAWDQVNYYQHSTGEGNGYQADWGTNASVGSGTNGLGQSNQWANPQGDTNNFQRYSTAADDLQWSRHDVHYGKEPSSYPTMMMHSFNTISSTNGLYVNSCMYSSANAYSTTSAGYFYIRSNSYAYKAGSKFWLWGLKVTNDF